VEDAPHFRDEAGDFAREGRILLGSTEKVEELLADQVSEGLLEEPNASRICRAA
jgi:hypothetical protein